MKRLLLIILVLIFSHLHADPGYAYKFQAEIELNNSEILLGSFYHYTYEKFDEKKHIGEAFKNFIQKEDITVYNTIIPVNTGQLNLDFAIKNSGITVKISSIKNIKTTNSTSFKVGDILIELSKNEYNLIQSFNPKFKLIYNETLAENCNYILLCWDEKTNLDAHQKDISKGLNIFSKDVINNQKALLEYLEFIKSQLLNDNILLIQYCEVL